MNAQAEAKDMALDKATPVAKHDASSALYRRPSKADISALPLFSGLDLQRIVVVDSEATLSVAKLALSEVTAIGFDTESKPTFVVGEKSSGPHLVQLATTEHAFLFPCRFAAGMEFVFSVLQSPHVTKFGFGLSSDKALFRRKYGIALAHCVDLSTLAKSAFRFHQAVGIRAAIAVLFNARISKSAQTSDWSTAHLTDHQKQYAANDAYGALCVALKLTELGLLR